MLQVERARSPFWREELNILYVAITRTKTCIRLSADTWQFLLAIGFRSDSEDAEPILPLGSSELKRVRKEDAVRWRLFEEECRNNKGFVIDHTCVPFPRGPSGNILALDDSYSAEDAQLTIATALLRWHPDKFMSRYGPWLQRGQDCPGSRLRQELARVTRKLVQLRRDYSLMGEAAALRQSPKNECPIC